MPRKTHLGAPKGLSEAAPLALIILVLTACATTRAPEPTHVELTMLSWNILHGANEEGELNLEAKGRYITEQAADLVLLQEIDERCERTEGVDQMAVLGQITGMNPAFGSFMPYQGGRYGLGMLSGRPVLETRSLRLPDGDEPRVALLREVEVLGRPLLVANVHFNWTEDDTSRYAQARALLAELETLDLPMVVGGDFNDTPESRTMQTFFAAGFEPVESPGPSFNARTPSRDIDHILIRSGPGLMLEPLGGQVLVEPGLSDHRPVAGRIRATISES